jgi:hypothetical protein
MFYIPALLWNIVIEKKKTFRKETGTYITLNLNFIICGRTVQMRGSLYLALTPYFYLMQSVEKSSFKHYLNLASINRLKHSRQDIQFCCVVRSSRNPFSILITSLFLDEICAKPKYGHLNEIVQRKVKM